MGPTILSIIARCPQFRGFQYISSRCGPALSTVERGYIFRAFPCTPIHFIFICLLYRRLGREVCLVYMYIHVLILSSQTHLVLQAVPIPKHLTQPNSSPATQPNSSLATQPNSIPPTHHSSPATHHSSPTLASLSSKVCSQVSHEPLYQS